MTGIVRTMRRQVRFALQRMGLHQQTLEALRVMDPRNRRYLHETRFVARFGDVEVQFNTDDSYSNGWFYPRYAHGGIHEKQVTSLLIEALRDARCFVDVGTNLGWYTCIAASHMPQGMVYGFEMDDLNFALLQRNIELNQLLNVHACHAAVADSEAVVTYQRSGLRPSPFFRMQGEGSAASGAQLVSVQSILLDRFFEQEQQSPDVIKIDVEGAEYNVLKGMSRILSEERPVLFLEIHPTLLQNFHSSARELLTLLIGYGYRIVQIEALREQESPLQLKPLTPESVIETNDMLYAVPE